MNLSFVLLYASVCNIVCVCKYERLFAPIREFAGKLDGCVCVYIR